MDKETPLQGGLTEACSGHLLDMTGGKTHHYLLRERLNLEWGFSDHWLLYMTRQFYMLASESGPITGLNFAITIPLPLLP